MRWQTHPLPPNQKHYLLLIPHDRSHHGLATGLHHSWWGDHGDLASICHFWWGDEGDPEVDLLFLLGLRGREDRLPPAINPKWQPKVFSPAFYYSITSDRKSLSIQHLSHAFTNSIYINNFSRYAY